MADKSEKRSPLETAGGAYVGYRRAGRRPESQQDREASANIPVAVARGLVSGTLGMPGDIESIARLPYELITGKESKTILPTSEDIEKRLPFRGASQTPVGQMFTGASQLAGGAYTGPLSGARAVMAVPRAVTRAGKDFVQAAGQPATNVIKPKGGNWLGGQNAAGVVENQLRRLKMGDSTTPEYIAGRMQRLEEAKAAGDDRAVRAVEADLDVARRNDAINSWIEGNLKNYVKKDMGTEGDPVRKLAEQGILHMEPYGTREAGSLVMRKRAGLGYPAQGMGQSEPAKFWERLSDAAIDAYPAGSYKHGAMDESLLKANPWLEKVPDETMIYSGKGMTRDLGFDHIIDVLRQDVRDGRIRPDQLSKVSMEQAVRRTYEFDQEMAKKMREAQIKATEGMPVHKEYPEGYKWVELTAKYPENLPEGFGDLEKFPKAARARKLDEPDKYIHGSDLQDLIRGIYRNFPETKGNPEKALEQALKYEGDTMGHCVGGYCPDVMEGRSRIYSLRDAKGEPHVTVEVQKPNWAPRHADVQRYMGAAEEEAKQLSSGYTSRDIEDIAVRMAKENAPPRIVQIKGKQNRAPNEQYLPFVQDFVRSGQWSDVGDFKNTGLYRKGDFIDEFTPNQLDAIGQGEYLTMDEIKKLREGKPWKPIDTDPEFDIDPNALGMKRGGSVSISDNPDAQMMDVMDKKLGGDVKMQAGGIARLLNAGKGAKKTPPAAETKIIQAPTVIVPSKLSNVKEAVRQSKGDYGARRVERAADEIPNLERMYKEEGLRYAFTGDNAQAMMTMNPANFERFANQLQTRNITEPKSFADKTRMSTEDYVNYLRTLPSGFDDVPFLGINKQEQGLPLKPFISGHEGRHRSRALAASGQPTSLVRLVPRAELREPFPRRTQEEYIQALRDELDLTGNLVMPEGGVRSAVVLPDIYAEGGEVKMQAGGLARMAKAAKASKAAKAEPSLPLELPRAPAKTREEIRPTAQRMAQQMTGEFVRPDPKKSINPAGKSRVQFEMERGLTHDIRPTPGKALLPQQVADIEKQLGMLKIGVSGDTTIADKTLYRAGPYKLDLPSPQHGGPLYALGGEGAWASNNPVAATFQKRVQELSQANKEAPVLGQFLAMGPQGSNFAMHFADANLRAIDPKKMSKQQVEQFNKLIREGSEKSGPRPGFPGIEDKESAYLHFAFDPELRKHFNAMMQLPNYTSNLGLPDGRVILHAITEPELRNTEVLTSGLSQMRLDPSVNPADLMLSAHPTYSHVIPKVPGSDISRTRYPVPAELEFPDVAEFIKKNYRPRDATRVYQTATPRQMVDPQHIDEMKMYEELMKEYTGKKKGGAVNDGLIKVQKKRKAKA